MANTEEAMKRALALSKRDQVMEHFKSSYDQLEMIAEDGPKSQSDVDIIKQCVCFVLGEVCFMKGDEDFQG